MVVLKTLYYRVNNLDLPRCSSSKSVNSVSQLDHIIYALDYSDAECG